VVLIAGGVLAVSAVGVGALSNYLGASAAFPDSGHSGNWRFRIIESDIVPACASTAWTARDIETVEMIGRYFSALLRGNYTKNC
jgi:hypothetical protein